MNFFPKLRRYYGILLVLLGGVHIALDASLEGLGSVAMIVASAWITARVLLRPTVFPKYPLSSLAIFVYSLVSEPVPMVGTLLDGHAVTYLLLNPLTTFGWVVFTQMLLLLGHAIYRGLKPCENVRAEISTRVFAPLGLFTPPTAIQLWIMGFGGIAAMFIAGVTAESGGALSKFVAGFIPMMYAPFLIVLHRFIENSSRKLGQLQTLAVGIYFLMIVVLSLISNSRGGFASVFAMLAFTVILGMFTGRLSAKLLRPRYLVPIGVACLAGLMVFSQLGLAMQVARKYRGQVSPVQMMRITLETLMDPARVRAMQQFNAAEVLNGNLGFWDERYISNVLLARLCPVRFHDLTLQAVNLYGPQNIEKVRNYSVTRFYAMFPDPVLKFFQISVNKDFINLFSVGDYMYFAATEQGLGVRRTGSFIAQGLTLFGWAGFAFYTVVFTVICSLALDAFFLRSGMQGRFSSLSILFIAQLAQIYTVESVNFHAEFFIRYLPQTILIYLLAFHGTGIFRISLQPVSERRLSSRASHLR